MRGHRPLVYTYYQNAACPVLVINYERIQFAKRMLQRLHFAVLLPLLFSCLACAQQPDYFVTQRLRLTSSSNGLNGWLEVLIDSRLTPELQKQMWGTGDWLFVLGEGDPRYAIFKAKPPRSAQLRISSSDGKQEDKTLTLDRPLARIKEAQLVRGRTSFFVAVDYSAGFGSYAGTLTQPLDIIGGQFLWGKSNSTVSKTAEPIRLPENLKSAWKPVPFRNGNKDILLIFCRPAKPGVADGNFMIGYVRYRFNGQYWVTYRQERKGMWEADQPFPPTSSFPQ